MKRILIVKTSSLGDIIQSMPVLDALHAQFPDCLIDWAVEESLLPIVAAHPLVHQAVGLKLKSVRNILSWKQFSRLREVHYDAVFDLQSNTKSGLVTFLAKSSCKVGLGKKSVREWPNVLATNVRFEVPLHWNIRRQHLFLLEQFFGQTVPEGQGVRFKISEQEAERVQAVVENTKLPRIMVCPGSKWVNKQLPLETWVQWLKLMDGTFFLVWGDPSEKAFCLEIQKRVPNSFVIDKLPIPVWQNLMHEMQLVLAVDSAALHLAGTTKTPTFSVFGPTNAEVFRPLGARHGSVAGTCPYNTKFVKTCPKLRTCPTGACIRELSADRLFTEFHTWWKQTQESS